MKKKINNTDNLTRAIAELELKAAAQKQDLRKSFVTVSENLTPLNLIKGGFRSVFSGEHKEELVNILIGLGTGILSRRLILGKPSGFVGKTMGKAIQWGMAGLVSKNAEKIKEIASEWIDKIFKKHKRNSNHTPSPVQKQINP